MKRILDRWLYGRKTGDDGYGNEIWTKPHWTARAARTIGGFGKENWRYLLTTGIAVTSFILLYRK